MKYQILVVEDDVSLKEVLTMALYSINPEIEVNWLTTAEEGLAELKNKPVFYHLLLIDIFLPGDLNGYRLWNEVKAFAPYLPVILMSGIGYEQFLAAIDNKKEVPSFLAKPFSISELRYLVESKLKQLNLIEKKAA